MITQIFQRTMIPTFVIDENHIITHWNKACEKLTNKTATEMIGTSNHRNVFSFTEKMILADLIVDGASGKEVDRNWSDGVRAPSYNDGAYEGVYLFSGSGENARWLLLTATPLLDTGGKIVGAIQTLQDITDYTYDRDELEHRVAELTKTNIELRREIETRKQTEDELRLREKKFCTVVECARKKGYEDLVASQEELGKRNEFIETILDNLPIGIAVHAISDGVIHYMNSAFTQIYGWPDHALKSFDAFFDHVYPDPKYRKIIKKRVVKDIASRDPAKMIWKNVLPTTQSGESRVVIATNIPLFEQDLMIATAQDVTEKNRVNQALQFTRFSIDRANDMIYWLDPHGTIIDVNTTVCKKLGHSRDELLSMTVMDINPDVTLKQFHKNWKSIKFYGTMRMETSHACKSGAILPVVTHSDYIEFDGKEYVCVFARDITERRNLERLIAIQDKMGSLGRVAAGIAHEIRNPLSTINVYLSTLKRLIATDDFDQGHLGRIEETISEMDTASHKIETVVKRVMDFSKPNQQRKHLTNVNICVKDAVDLSLVTMRKSGVTMVMQLDERLPECYMDCQLIEQVVLNLITNAREELIEWKGEKQLEIRTVLKNHYDGEKFIVITVADSGPGVSVEVRNKIFDPFYTTKQYGSGIGLSICHRIISDHDGFLHIATSRWGGAEFTAEFPVRRKVEDK